jgi:hypothetical protein
LIETTPTPPLPEASNLLMRLNRSIAIVFSLVFLGGCRKHTYVVPEGPMPPNTIMLSQMMQQLSAKPGFTEGLLSQIDKGGKKGPALLTPSLVDELRKRILGSDWQGLDRFPGWTMRRINPTVRVAGHFAGKSNKLEDASAVHPGAPLGTPAATPTSHEYLDLGPYALNKAETVSLSEPSTLPSFTTQGIVTTLGDGVTRGDGPNALAPEHAESQRLADVLNRLAANKLEDVRSFVVRLQPAMQATNFYGEARTPDQLLQLLQGSGHTVTVDDARYFANFGHFHFGGEDVMMPFWIDSQLIIPDSGGRHLLVPASHAEYEWHVRGPRINADVSYYFGIDGKSEWRTMDTLDQPWVLRRAAHTYSGAQAIEVTRLAGLLTVAYMHLHDAHPTLPFGGYYALGVCQDGVSAIEHAMTGHVTMFPNTADPAAFNDPRDTEVNALFAAIPKDRDGKPPTPDRIFGSLPTTNFADITIPGLASDLDATYAAWKNGKLETRHSFNPFKTIGIIVAALLAIAALFAFTRRKR